jgi:hypothetical protein
MLLLSMALNRGSVVGPLMCPDNENKGALCPLNALEAMFP